MHRFIFKSSKEGSRNTILQHCDKECSFLEISELKVFSIIYVMTKKMETIKGFNPHKLFQRRKPKGGLLKILKINIELLTVPNTPLNEQNKWDTKCSFLSFSVRWQELYFVQIGEVSNQVLLDTTYQYLLPYLLDVLIFS